MQTPISSNKYLSLLWDYIILTGCSILIALSIHLFQLPNHFVFGGVTGLAILFSTVTGISFSLFNIIVNLVLIAAAFLTIGKDFGIRTVYVALLTSFSFQVLEKIVVIEKPLTGQPLLEAMIVIFTIAVLSAELFERGACSGGTDIAAMIIRKYAKINIGTALLAVDLVAAVFTFFIYGVEIGIFSLTGLLAKSFIIDSVVEMINNCKYFTIICTDPKPIQDYIRSTVKRGATVSYAYGNYNGEKRVIINTAVRRQQAIRLRNFINQNCPDAFMIITNTSEIIGKGFLLE